MSKKHGATGQIRQYDKGRAERDADRIDSADVRRVLAEHGAKVARVLLHVGSNTLTIIGRRMRKELGLPAVGRWAYVADTDNNYCVSDCGAVLSCRMRPAWTPVTVFKGSGGYATFSATRRSKGKQVSRRRRLHVVLLESFVGPRPGPGYIGCHRDDNRDNNSLDNLYWGTHSSNGQDAVRNSRHSNYVDNDTAKRIYTSGGRTPDIARQFNLDVETVRRIRRGRSHACILGELPAGQIVPYEQKKRGQDRTYAFSDEEVIDMRRRHRAGEGVRQIARSLGKKYPTVRTAIKGDSYSWIPSEEECT